MAAALAEFAARGFAGARVDRIAAAARLNKAMLYYHFGSKQRLYRATLQRLLGRLADQLETVTASPASATDRLEAFVATFIRLGLSEPRVAPVMLREVAEGASHLDRDTVNLVVRLASSMTRIVSDGQRTGEFRQANSMMVYLTTIWPIMVYLASGPIRDTIHRHANVDVSGFEPEAFTRHMQDVCYRSLAVDPGRRPLRPARRHPTEHAS
jgi:TetR/AcrR family transcriptional regulator